MYTQVSVRILSTRYVERLSKEYILNTGLFVDTSLEFSQLCRPQVINNKFKPFYQRLTLNPFYRLFACSFIVHVFINNAKTHLEIVRRSSCPAG